MKRLQSSQKTDQGFYILPESKRLARNSLNDEGANVIYISLSWAEKSLGHEADLKYISIRYLRAYHRATKRPMQLPVGLIAKLVEK